MLLLKNTINFGYTDKNILKKCSSNKRLFLRIIKFLLLKPVTSTTVKAVLWESSQVMLKLKQK